MRIFDVCVWGGDDYPGAVKLRVPILFPPKRENIVHTHKHDRNGFETVAMFKCPCILLQNELSLIRS